MTGRREGFGWLRAYYAVTPLFVLADFAFGANVRAVANPFSPGFHAELPDGRGDLDGQLPRDDARYRTSRKNARTSSTRRSGSSSAAKCPPAGISVQRFTLKRAYAQRRGGGRMSL